MSERDTPSRLLIRSVAPTTSLDTRGRRPARRRGAVLRSELPPGYLDGLHHTLFVSAIRTLKSSGQRGDLEHLLLRLVDATEAEARHTGCAVATGYYRELARLYRKANDPASEHAILVRFAAQTHAPGMRARRLVKRLSTVPATGKVPPARAQGEAKES